MTGAMLKSRVMMGWAIGFALAFAAMTGQHAAAQTTPITIQQHKDLKFAKAAGDANQSGTVIIDATTGSKTTTGGAVDFGGKHQRAEFNVRGDPNLGFTITLPGQIQITGQNTSAVATVKNFASVPANFGVLNAQGKATVYVGATLELQPGQTADDYNGQFDVIVNYQ